jgi:6-phosphogluconate dehydrogenase
MQIGLFGNHTGLARRLAAAGFGIVAYAGAGRLPATTGIEAVEHLQALFDRLEHPRRFVLDLPTGPDIDRVIDEAYVVMEPGDVVLDATPSYWGDTLRRHRRMRHRSIYYVDVALIEHPATAMASGDERGVALAMPLVEHLAATGKAIHAGEAGAAHFALMVHAGVAMAIEHAVSEARQLLEAYPNDADPIGIADLLWSSRSRASPAAAWLLDDAVRLHAVIPLLAQGVMLELGAALDDHRAVDVPPRVGGFIHPDDIR